MFDNIWFNIDIILNRFFWWTDNVYNVLNTSIPQSIIHLTIFLIFLILILKVYSKYNKLDLTNYLKYSLKLFLIWWIISYVFLSLNLWNNNWEVITKNCFDQKQIDEMIDWQFQNNLYNLKTYWYYFVSSSLWNYLNSNIYCNLKENNLFVKYVYIDYDKYLKEKEVKNILDNIEKDNNTDNNIVFIKKTIVSNLYNKLWYIEYKNKKYKICSLYDCWNIIDNNKYIVMLDYNEIWPDIELLFIDKDTKKIYIVKTENILYYYANKLKDNNLIKKIFKKEDFYNIDKQRKSIYFKYLYSSVVDLNKYFIILWYYNNNNNLELDYYNINWKKYYDFYQIYKKINQYENWKSDLDVVWANIAFNNWKFISREMKQILPINIVSNSLYYKIYESSTIEPISWNVVETFALLLFFKIINYLSLIWIILFVNKID